MNPDDDPEARIRALEQPLADKARASELGSTPYTPPGEAYVPPPLPPMPPPAQGPYTPPGEAYVRPPLPPRPPPAQGPYTPPGYNPQQGYNAQQGYGAPWSPPPRRSSGG